MHCVGYCTSKVRDARSTKYQTQTSVSSIHLGQYYNLYFMLLVLQEEATRYTFCWWQGKHVAVFCATGMTGMLATLGATCKACKGVAQKQETRYLHGYEGGTSPR
jgi:hypothetical protein